jgi:Lrp/AsnC family transcriptional regulator, regulator for asnA, asnC and gidA
VEKTPDKIDRLIMAALHADGRTPNKTLAKRLGVSETTIAARIRSLIDRNVMRVTVQRDIYSLGYQFHGFADLYVFGRNVDDVADDASGIEGVLSVSLHLGSPDIMVGFGARDRADLARILNDELSNLPGVQRLDSYIALEIRKYQSGYAALGEQ